MNFSERSFFQDPRLHSLFWVAVGLLAIARLVLVADLSVDIQFSPHDDSLYVMRAFHLLRGEGFGAYDSRILIKYPGISYWLAANRAIGMPYLLSIQILYITAGVYFCSALLRSGIARWAILFALALYLFNPLTLGTWWTRVIREPLATTLYVFFFAAWIHIVAAIGRSKLPICHSVTAALAFAIALYVREDDILLWVLLGSLSIFTLWYLWHQRRFTGWFATQIIALAIVMPAAGAIAVGSAAKAFSERYYGLPIIHEMSQGEFPQMLGAIRSIKTQKDNRMVMVTQEALAKMRTEVPAFAPVIARLPPPGPATFSCQLHGVCSEWSNGWMPFWIKDAAYDAGLTPTLPAAQSYFRSIRLDIEKACAEQRLQCRDNGSKLLPPMQLRWTRAYVKELFALIGLVLRPDPAVIEHPHPLFKVDVELGRVFQALTMTDHFDTQWQTTASQDARILVQNPLAKWRPIIARAYLLLGPLALIVLIGAFLLRLISDKPFDGFVAVASVVLAFLFLRLLALAYICVFLGPVDSRLIITTHVVAMLIAVPYLSASLRWPWRNARPRVRLYEGVT